jgi:hypothetical protein
MEALKAGRFGRVQMMLYRGRSQYYDGSAGAQPFWTRFIDA